MTVLVSPLKSLADKEDKFCKTDPDVPPKTVAFAFTATLMLDSTELEPNKFFASRSPIFWIVFTVDIVPDFELFDELFELIPTLPIETDAFPRTLEMIVDSELEICLPDKSPMRCIEEATLNPAKPKLTIPPSFTVTVDLTSAKEA